MKSRAKALRTAAVAEAASWLFAERGYDGVSTRTIADAAGVSQPYVIRRFGSKEALYELVLNCELDAFLAGLREASGASDPSSGTDMVDVLIAAHRRFVRGSVAARLVALLWTPNHDHQLERARIRLWNCLRSEHGLSESQTAEFIGRVGADIGAAVFERTRPVATADFSSVVDSVPVNPRTRALSPPPDRG